jgi:hypothetical protein
LFYRKHSSNISFLTVAGLNFAQREGKAMAKGAIIFHKGVRAIKPGATNWSSKERKVTEGKEGKKLLLNELFFCFYS